MQTIRVDKHTVLETLRKNRASHEQILKESEEGYRNHVIKVLKAHLSAAKSGKNIENYISFTPPVSNIDEYDAAIGMLELSLDDEIQLTEDKFRTWVLDKWNWKRNFLLSNSAYSATAMSFSNGGLVE